MTNENSGMIKALNGGLDSFPEWRQALEKKVELQLRLQEINSRLSELDSQISNSAETDPVKKRAQVLLDEGRLPSKTDIDGLRLNLSDVLDERSVVTEALQIQSREQANIRAEISAKLCAEAAPIYGEIVAKLAAALIDLGKILDTERSFRRGLEDSGIAWLGHIYPMALISLGDPTDSFSRISMYLKECCEYGFITENAIPREWLDRWDR